MSKSSTTQKFTALMLSLIMIMGIASVSTAAEAGEPPVDTSSEITGFAALDEAVAEQHVAAGAHWAELALPEQLLATVNAEAASIGVVWQSTPEYDGGLAGTYLLTPVLPENYTVAEGVILPIITVTVEEPMLPMLRSLDEGASPHAGDIGLHPYPFVPKHWKAADGGSLAVATNTELFDLIRNRFGGDGATSFNLPNLINYTSDIHLRYDIAVNDAAGREPVISEVRLFPYDAETAMPSVWRRCDGRLLGIGSSDANDSLFHFIGIAYGGDGENTFALPDLRALEPQGMGYYICLPDVPNILIADASIGEMILIAGNPLGTSMDENILPCDGRLLPIATNQALFSLLGTSFGGDGISNFAIPDTCGGSGSPSSLINPLPDMQYYIIISGTTPRY